MNRGEKTKKDEPWKQYCDKGHFYIKGPVNGWLGVKNGAMRLLGEELDIPDESIIGCGEEKVEVNKDAAASERDVQHETGEPKAKETIGTKDSVKDDENQDAETDSKTANANGKEDIDTKKEADTQMVALSLNASAESATQQSFHIIELHLGHDPKSMAEEIKVAKEELEKKESHVNGKPRKVENIPVKVWIGGLRERWKEAWERYWVSGGGIRDIGTELEKGAWESMRKRAVEGHTEEITSEISRNEKRRDGKKDDKETNDEEKDDEEKQEAKEDEAKNATLLEKV